MAQGKGYRSMKSGSQHGFKGAGSDPYNKAGKAEGRDATSWKGKSK